MSRTCCSTTAGRYRQGGNGSKIDVLRTHYRFESPAALRRRLTADSYRFTFSDRFTVDGSVPGSRHFVYTDHTHPANRMVSRNLCRIGNLSTEWIELEREIYHRATRVFTFSSNIGRSPKKIGVEPAKIRCAYAGSNLSRRPGASRRVPGGKTILSWEWNGNWKGGSALVAAFRKCAGLRGIRRESW